MQEQLLKGASRASSQSFSCGQRLHNASLVPAVPLAPGKRQLSLPCPRMEVQRLPSILTRHQGFSTSILLCPGMELEDWEALGEEQLSYQRDTARAANQSVTTPGDRQVLLSSSPRE